MKSASPITRTAQSHVYTDITAGDRPVERRLRIVHVLYLYAPYRSGLTIYAERLCVELATRGHDVHVIAARHDRALPVHETIDGVRVTRLPVRASFSRAVVVPSLIPRVLAMLRGADVLHLSLPLAEAAPLAALGRAMGKRIICAHLADLELSASRLERLASHAALWSGIAAARLAHGTVTNTTDRIATSPTMRRVQQGVHVIAPPIVAPQPTMSPEAFRAAQGLGPGPVVGFAGRMTFEKGIDVLAASLPHVRERWPSVTFAFAGPTTGPGGAALTGPWDADLARYPENVRRLGSLSWDDLANFYAACDVLALPSTNLTETFGMVQVEAMLCGTPVVASDLPGVREPIAVTGMGRVVRTGNARELAVGLIEVIANRAQYVQRRNEVARHYDLDRSVDAYERLYRDDPGSP